MDRNLALEFVRVTEAAALSCGRLMGRGDETAADQAAVDAMRRAFDALPIRGEIVIGEGERDEAPMLFIGEKVGRGGPSDVEVDIACDPLEGTTLCATGGANSISVIAIAEKGGFLRAPDTYMEKIAVGPACRGVIDLNKSPTENLRAIADAKGVYVEDLTVVILNRPRHERLIKEVRTAGARIKLIGDGDLAPGIAAAVRGTGVHAVMGTGGAPEGVITAAAMRCLNGYMVGRLTGYTDEQKERMAQYGINDIHKTYTAEELAPGENIIFAATGVTDGPLMQGVRFFGEGVRTSSMIMKMASRKVRFVEGIHIEQNKEFAVRF